MKLYTGISRDHSGSMAHIAHLAARDYNENVQIIKEQALANNIDTVVSVIKCGTGRPAKNVFETINSSVSALKPIPERNYYADGNNTPLFDSVSDLIDEMENVPDASNSDVSFIVMAITDGEDNASRNTAATLGARIRALQSTDRWTFVFRVPRGYKRALVGMGIPEFNIQEWEQSEKGIQVATAQTTAAFSSYYQGLASGVRSTNKFFTDLSQVSTQEIKANLVDVSKEVKFFTVATAQDGSALREFCESKTGQPLLKGSAFYQLVKSEPKVQDYKQIAIRDKSTGHVYSGVQARNILGLPHVGDVKLAPGNHGKYDIFIQSTSVNRKLPVGTQVLYWEKIGLPYKEGVSAR